MMKKLLVSSSILVGGIFLFAYLNYGSISPCGILKNSVKRELAKESMEKLASSDGGLEVLGLSFGAKMVDSMVDTAISALSPAQCVDKFISFKRGESGIFDFKKSASTPVISQIKKSQKSSFEEQKAKLQKEMDDLLPKTWKTEISTSPMDDSKEVTLSVYPVEQIKSWLGENMYPSLLLRCKRNKTDALLFAGSEIGYEWHDGDKKYYGRTRLGTENPKKVDFTPSTNGKAVFFPEPISFIKEMMDSETLLLEFTPYKQGARMLTFNVSGLKEKIAPLRDACHW